MRGNEHSCNDATLSLCIIVFFSVCFLPILYMVRFIARRKKKTVIALVSTYMLGVYLL